jgi:hypothetical protein
MRWKDPRADIRITGILLACLVPPPGDTEKSCDEEGGEAINKLAVGLITGSGLFQHFEGFPDILAYSFE